MSQYICNGVRDLLLLELRLCLRYGKVMSLSLIGRQDCQQNNGKHCKDN